MIGRGAFHSATAVNADPSQDGGRCTAMYAGVDGNADVGMSNDKTSGNLVHRKSKVS